MDVLWKRVKDEPVMFTFLGLTVAALGGGLRSLATGDKRSSQTMMRARVFFQLCTVCTLVGTVYWRAYTGEQGAMPARPRQAPIAWALHAHTPHPSPRGPTQSWAGAAPRGLPCQTTSQTSAQRTRWRFGRAGRAQQLLRSHEVFQKKNTIYRRKEHLPSCMGPSRPPRPLPPGACQWRTPGSLLRAAPWRPGCCAHQRGRRACSCPRTRAPSPGP